MITNTAVKLTRFTGMAIPQRKPSIFTYAP